MTPARKHGVNTIILQRTATRRVIDAGPHLHLRRKHLEHLLPQRGVRLPETPVYSRQRLPRHRNPGAKFTGAWRRRKAREGDLYFSRICVSPLHNMHAFSRAKLRRFVSHRVQAGDTWKDRSGRRYWAMPKTQRMPRGALNEGTTKTRRQREWNPAHSSVMAVV